MSKEKEIAEKKESQIALLDNYFEEEAVTGFEDMGKEDLALPFLKVMTNMSPELESVDGAKVGMLFNSVTGDLYAGDEGLKVIPCAYLRQYIEWTPRGSGSGLVGIHSATSDILSKTHKQPQDNKDYLDNGNYVENTANYYIMYLDGDGFPVPAIISMKSTQLKKSRKWNSMMSSVKMQGANGLFTPPMFSQVYRVATVKEQNDKGSWHGWDISRIGKIEDASIYQLAKEFAASIGAGEVKVKFDGEETATNKTEEDNDNIF
tara:strand:- start:3997 stop:4782 length:786 start_codon:yes stop_codon:yes gene_type:complete